jgi:hypothetical protein
MIMEHARTPGFIAYRGLAGLLLAGLVLSTTGCNGAATPEEKAGQGPIGTSTEAQTAFNLYILNVTNATLTNLTLTFEASVGSTTHYLDSERVKGSLYAPNVWPYNCSMMQIGDDPANELREVGFSQNCDPGFPNHSIIRVTDYSVPKFPLAKIRINGYVNGECFEDWEVVDWFTPPALFLNASGGASNGTCKLGNFLKPYY